MAYVIVKVERNAQKRVVPEEPRNFTVQCNLDLVTLLVSAKTVTKSHNVAKLNDFM